MDVEFVAIHSISAENEFADYLAALESSVRTAFAMPASAFTAARVPPLFAPNLDLAD